MTRTSVPAGLLLCAILGAAPATAQNRTPPSLEDLFQHQGVGNVQLAPSGEMVLYTVGTTNLTENENNTEIWVARTGGGEPIQLTRNPKNDTRPRWRPGSTEFGFLSTRGEGEKARTSIYQMSPLGGESEQLYQHATSIGTFEWSPDGRQIVFTAPEEESKERKDVEEQGRDVEIEDGPTTHSHLWLLDVATKKARRLTGRDETAGDFTIQNYAWSPDGSSIAFAAAPSTNLSFAWQSDLHIIAVTDSTARARKLVDNPGPDGSPVFSPDGQWIYFQGYLTPSFRIGQSRLYRVSTAGGTPEDVTPGDLDPGAVFVTANGIWFSATSGTTTGLYFMQHGAREPVRITADDGVYGNFSFSEDMQRVAYTHESPTRPAEVYTATLTTRSMPPRPAQQTALTSHNAEMAKYAVGRTEVLRWKGADGRDVEGVVVYPMNYNGNRRVPLVVKIHGGPSGVYTQNFQAAGYGSNAQLYAADGYAVLLPNPRGSSGYGDDGQRSVIKDWGGLDFQDIMRGVDALIERGVAHPDSLGVMGWSYGGYMTAWAVTQTDRFKAAVNGAGITEPIAMWGTQDIIQVFEGYFGGSPFEDGGWEVYQKSSPMAHVRNVKTPTLMIHGKNDPRVPPNQAQIFFRSLRALNVPTELVWLPRSGHGPSEPGLQYETAKRQKEWMDRWIRGVGKPIT